MTKITIYNSNQIKYYRNLFLIEMKLIIIQTCIIINLEPISIL